jgi:predicted ATPase
MRAGLATFDAMKFYLLRASFLGMLCEVEALAGALNDAIASADLALQTNPDELLYRPAALLLRGELRLRASQDKSHLDRAEEDFCEAIELAQSMGAKSYELRATTSLARLRRDTNRRDQARTMLAEIYNWFTEGFDTADLKDAKALLDELSA